MISILSLRYVEANYGCVQLHRPVQLHLRRKRSTWRQWFRKEELWQERLPDLDYWKVLEEGKSGALEDWDTV